MIKGEWLFDLIGFSTMLCDVATKYLIVDSLF